MSAGPAPRKTWTPEEYLAWERRSPEKHEYFQGEIFAMTGASRAHNKIVVNLGGELRSALRQRPCEVYTSDMRVKIPATGLYTYPDVVVVCCEPVFEQDAELDTLLNPDVLFEVLSETTESYDRGRKFAQYRTLASLREYLLVSQGEALVEHYTREENGLWTFREHRAGGRVRLESIGCEVAVDEIYLKVLGG